MYSLFLLSENVRRISKIATKMFYVTYRTLLQKFMFLNIILWTNDLFTSFQGCQFAVENACAL